MQPTRKWNERWRRFLLEQLASTVQRGELRPFSIDPDGIWFETAHGFSVLCNVEDHILDLDVHPVWREMETTFISNNVRPGDVFLDIGAGIGYFSLLAAQNQPAKVVAFEPVPGTFDLLVRNIEHNKLGEIIEPVNIGLGSRDRTAKSICVLGPRNHIEYTLDDDDADLATVEVRIGSLDGWLKEHASLDKIDVIMVDIEGYEHEFLRGARQTILSFRPMVLMNIEDYQLAKFCVTAQDVFDFMKEAGYEYLCLGPDEIVPGTRPEADLSMTRNFVFYAPHRHPAY